MMIACACGGILEVLVLTAAGGAGLLAAAWLKFKNMFRRNG